MILVTRNGRMPHLSVNTLLLFLVTMAIFVFRNSFGGSQVESRDIKQKYDDAKAKADQLDRHYLSRLIYHPADSDSTHQAVAGEEIELSNYTTALVLGRLSAEEKETEWIYNLKNIDRYQIYIVDNPNSAFPHLERNHGREAAVYLHYIIDNYEDLPDITFFWHNAEVVWHNNLLMAWNSVETINRMDRENIIRSGYVPSRCDHWPGCPSWIRFNPSKAEHRLDPHRLEDMFIPELFQTLFPGETEFPPYFAGTCCSQFAASRDAIQSRPLATYKAMFDWILTYESDLRSGMIFEFSWPYIFLRRGTLCPAMSECYCKTYNFCIKDPKDVEDLERWNGLRTRREEVKWQVAFMEDARDMRQRQKEKEGASQDEVLAIEELFNPELDRLDNELERLVNTTWQAREDIIKYWKLPAPPVGW